MKVLKDKYIHYSTLEDSLENLAAKSISAANVEFDKKELSLSPAEQQKRIRFFYVAKNLNDNLEASTTFEEILECLRTALKQIIPLKGAFFFMFDNTMTLVPIGKQKQQAYTDFINKANNSGIFDWNFESKNISVLPDITRIKNPANSLNILVLPLFKNGKPFGLYAVKTPINSLSSNSFEIEVIKIFLSTIQNKIDLFRREKALSNALEDIQALQSKLTNDYKYSAIGELTAGIVEDVMSPAQVIMSCANFIDKEYENVDKKIVGALSSQIKKIETVIKRLSKFIGTNSAINSFYPCNINNAIEDYNDVVLSSLTYKNYECLLDLDSNLPSVLTQKSYIHQVLSNLFGLILNSESEGGGILLQTKLFDDNVCVKFVVTDRLSIYAQDNRSKKVNLNVRMISNIMKLHQGTVKIANNESGGTTVTLNFPLKRKLKK